MSHVPEPEADGLRPIKDAPRNGVSIVILTPAAAHKAEWDARFRNFWSITAERALEEDECVGWMSALAWRTFVLGNDPRALARDVPEKNP